MLKWQYFSPIEGGVHVSLCLSSDGINQIVCVILRVIYFISIVELHRRRYQCISHVVTGAIFCLEYEKGVMLSSMPLCVWGVN